MAKLPSYKGGRRGKAKPVERKDLKAQNLHTEDETTKILDELHELFDGTYSVVRPGPWKRAFRPSGFPYCPVIDAMAGTEDMDYSKAFYLDIGTTVHELMQEYISRSGIGRRRVYCDWKCKDCGGMHHFMPLPYVCHHCGADSERLHYEELAFENTHGIQGGHVDLLVRVTGGWLVCDWKTASTTGLDFRTEADGKHHHQLQAYCLVLQERFKDKLEGLPIIGYCLIFVPRDKSGNGKPGSQFTSNWTPYLYLWDKKLAKETRERLFVGRASYEAASIGYETGNWLPAAMMRPCESLEDFGKTMGMRDAFYGGKLCPNLEVCCKGSQAVADAITKHRAEMAKSDSEARDKATEEKTRFLQSVALGILPPELDAAIIESQESDDYDSEHHESLLAKRESLERLATHMNDRTKKRVARFFNERKPKQNKGL